MRLSRRYILSGVMGQPWGGLITYFLSSGRTDCTNACEISLDLGMRFIVVTIKIKSRKLRGEMTGAK